ncbi:MAG: tRNA (adenosine(37)-N6)-dimethylallyltransferase MiaA, partial [Saprospiraceae bacterium]
VLLNMERAALYERIERRVDAMLAAGLLEEARLLFPNRHLKALQTVGYQELFAHFAGEIPMEKAVELIKQNSRRYAKRQMTWFRKDSHWREFSPDGKLEILHWIEKAVGSGF